MLRSLTGRVLAPVALLGLAAVGAGAWEVYARLQLQERMAAITVMRERLEGAVQQVEGRHLLTVRRARGAMHTDDQRVALLAWTSEQYSVEMHRLLTEAQRAVTTLKVPGAHPRLGADLERIGAQLNVVDERSEAVAAALDSLLGGASAEDEEEMQSGALELDRADSALTAALQRCGDLVRRASTWQLRELAPRRAWLSMPLAFLLVWIPVALWLVMRPLAAIRRLSRGDEPRGPPTQESRAIQDRIKNAQADEESMRALLAERDRDAERGNQSARRAQRELALLKLYNENLVNSLRSAIVVTDAATEITGFNRAARNLLGLSEDDLGTPAAGLPLYLALAAHAAGADEEVARALAGAVLRRESLQYHGGDAEVLLDLTVAPYLDEGGAPRGLLWVCDDVTDAVHIKNQLLAAEHLAAVGRLSAQVAHEIRNPLSAIGLNAELLEEELGLLDPERPPIETGLTAERVHDSRTLVAAIASEVERLSEVTESYLELARMPRPACRDAISTSSSAICSRCWARRCVRARSTLSSSSTPAAHAWVDPGQLRQAMLNIVRNSREAMPTGGTLRVRTVTNGERSSLEFVDSGVGIDPEAQRRAFEPFYSTKPNGTGLGLSLTEQILAEHNGSIEILPAVRQPGTRVVLNLPIRAPI